MTRYRLMSCGVALLVLPLLLTGCSRGPTEEEARQAALGEPLANIQAEFDQLTTVRSDLTAAKERLAELEGLRQLDDELKLELEALPGRIDELTATREAGFEALQDKLAEFLNLALNEYPQAPETVQALEIYSKEALSGAADVVAKSGDYSKAIEQLRSVQNYYESVELDPFPALEERIAEYDAIRFIDDDRFKSVTNGMTRDEVSAAIGFPYYQNIQVDEKRGVETWLYKKREGGAAAIYFKTTNGKVYGKKFDAIKVQVVD